MYGKPITWLVHRPSHTDAQMYKQMDRQTDRQTDRRVDGSHIKISYYYRFHGGDIRHVVNQMNVNEVKNPETEQGKFAVIT